VDTDKLCTLASLQLHEVCVCVCVTNVQSLNDYGILMITLGCFLSVATNNWSDCLKLVYCTAVLELLPLFRDQLSNTQGNFIRVIVKERANFDTVSYDYRLAQLMYWYLNTQFVHMMGKLTVKH